VRAPVASAIVAERFAQQGFQVAQGVPFKIDEPANTVTFRVGLFGLDKLRDPQKTCDDFVAALDAIIAKGWQNRD